MRRQQETAAEAIRSYTTAGLRFPDPQADAGWSEFDLGRIHRELAPCLSADDPEFRTAYEQMQMEMAAAAGDPSAHVHRRWSQPDLKVVEAWIRGRYTYAGESWDAFCRRVRGCILGTNGTPDGNVAVFTSATPIAIWAGVGMDVFDERVLRVAGVLHNASFTVLRIRSGKVRLFSLNNIPHLRDPDLRTFR